MFLSILLLTLVILPSSVQSSTLNIEHAGYALNALQRLLNFFERDSQNINVDGLFCLRIAQGQLISLQQLLTSAVINDEGNYFTDQNHIIESLSQQIDRITNESWNEIVRRTPEYFQRFQILLSKPFTFESDAKKLQFNLIETNNKKDSFFDTVQSDACFSELITTSCSISETCWTKMTSNSTTSYRLTHQLLWILIAKNMNCANIRSLIQIEHYFCANIYADATFNLINKTNEDLFLEQLLLCAIDGFDEFLRFDWLLTILKWQDPLNDCFGEEKSTMLRGRRHLLVEQTMSNGCLSHKSGLAAGLLATFTKFFLTNLKNK